MANVEVGNIRNVALIAHSGAGKTSLAEAMLFSSGMTDRLGNVQDGTTVTDFEPEQIDRKITITSSLAFCNWNKYRINIVDTPGFINFIEGPVASAVSTGTRDGGSVSPVAQRGLGVQRLGPRVNVYRVSLASLVRRYTRCQMAGVVKSRGQLEPVRRGPSFAYVLAYGWGRGQ